MKTILHVRGLEKSGLLIVQTAGNRSFPSPPKFWDERNNTVQNVIPSFGKELAISSKPSSDHYSTAAELR